MFWIGYWGSLSASLPQKLLLLQHPHYWTKMKMRNHWLGFKTVLHESVEWLMWKVWRRSVFRCFRRAFVFLFGRTGRATLIPAPVSKCPSSRTWLDKFPLRWPCGPHGPTWTHTLQPWGRGQGENCKSGISDTVLIAKSLLKFKKKKTVKKKQKREKNLLFVISSTFCHRFIFSIFWGEWF